MIAIVLQGRRQVARTVHEQQIVRMIMFIASA